MNKYVCSIITPRSGGAILAAKIREKIEYRDITTEQFSIDYDGSLYAIGDTEEEAFNNANKILLLYQTYLHRLAVKMDSLNK